MANSAALTASAAHHESVVISKPNDATAIATP
jgi:hypothetical protein